MWDNVRKRPTAVRKVERKTQRLGCQSANLRKRVGDKVVLLQFESQLEQPRAIDQQSADLVQMGDESA